jgi:hypothetical protein
MIALPREPSDSNAGAHRQLEVRCVPFEVIPHLVLGRFDAGAGRESKTRKTIVEGGTEETERVPAFPPGVAHSRVGVENDKGDPSPSEVIPDREASLTAAHDHDLEPFVDLHDSSPLRTGDSIDGEMIGKGGSSPHRAKWPSGGGHAVGISM